MQRESEVFVFLHSFSCLARESHDLYHVKKESRDIKILTRFQPMCVWGGRGGHSKFRVIPQSPVQFVTDPACGAFDLVVSVEV